MATPTGTTLTRDVKTIREDLEAGVNEVYFDLTPLLNDMGDRKATNTNPEWTTRTLAPPSADNAAGEGADAVINDHRPSARLSNQTQTLTKALRVSGTAQAITSSDDMTVKGRDTHERLIEIMNDFESSIFANKAKSAGSGASPIRIMGGLPSYLNENAQVGTGGGLSQGDGSVARVKSTEANQRVLTEAMVAKAVEDVWSQCGSKDLKWYQSQQMITYTGYAFKGAVQRYTSEPTTIQSGVVIFRTPLGSLTAVASANIEKDYTAILDPSMVKKITLRGMERSPIAKTGDADTMQLLMEKSLQVDNPLGCAAIYDVKPGTIVPISNGG